MGILEKKKSKNSIKIKFTKEEKMISDRKLEHIMICKNYDVSYKNKTTGFEDIELIHRALPEVHKDEIDLSSEVFGKKLDSPLFITAITIRNPGKSTRNWQLLLKTEE